MLDKPDEIVKAVSTISEARVTIWNARLQLAMRVGDAKLIDKLLSHSPVADGSGCDCGCGGASFFQTPEQVAQPQVR
jgi:hypothetical protein